MAEGTIVLIGGGGHALVVAEGARLAGLQVAGFFDDDPRAALAGDTRWLGAIGDWRTSRSADGVIVALGSLARRSAMVAGSQGSADADRFRTVIHPSAIASAGARIGP